MYENGLPPTVTSTKSPQYKRQEPEWNMINALLGGTGTIRAFGEAYLPKHKNETQKQYETRLYKAVLAPFFKRTANFATGKAFYKPMKVEPREGVIMSGEFEAVLADADRKFNNINTFANKAFKQCWAKGMGFIYVEAPAYDPALVRNEQQRKQLDIRPYLLFVAPEKLLDVAVNNRGEIIYAKILEYYTDFDDALKTTVEKARIRLVTPEWIGIYNQVASKSQVTSLTIDDIGTYRLAEDPIPNRIGKVPLVPVYTGELQTDFECTSNLIDLAYTNVQYYQDESTHETAVSAAEFPLLCLTGGKGEEVTIGPFRLITIKDPAGKLHYVEHSGAALEAGRKNLEELRIKAAYCGLKTLMSDNAGSRKQTTATEAKFDNIDSNSDLKVAGDNFADAMSMALWYVQRYLGEISAEDDLQYDVALDGIFSFTAEDFKEVSALMELESTGKMRLESLYKELKRRNTLSDDFDIESEVEFAIENASNPNGL